MDMARRLKIMDVTLRDGGLTNSFKFDDDFVKQLYITNLKAGIDYMEFGYKADSDMFSKDDYGVWKFCKEEDIRKIVQTNNTNMKLSVMADVGRTNYQRDILNKRDSVIDMVRVATYSYQLDNALEMIEAIHEKGYEVTCNIMALSTDCESNIELMLEQLGHSAVDGIYLVDSYGAFYPNDVIEMTKIFVRFAKEYGKYIGIHTHNNQQLAVANTILAIENGATMVDASMNGIGRGAGNCPIENIIAYLRNDDYHFEPICEFIEDKMYSLKKKGVNWGCEIPYLVTGMLNQHPRKAIEFFSQKDGKITDFYKNVLFERKR